MKKTFTLVMLVLSIYAKAQIGIGTTSPNTTLDVRGSLAVNSRSFSTTSEAVLSTDYTLLFTGTSACTLTLPDATAWPGRIINVKNTKTGTVPVLTIATTASQTIDGLSTWSLDDPNESVNLVSDGSNWKIAGQSLPAGSGTSWTQGGNTVASIKKLGTIDAYDLPFITSNTERMRLTGTGLGIGTTTPAEKLEVAGNIKINGGNRKIIFGALAGDPDAVIEYRVYNGSDFSEMLFYVGNDADDSYGPDRIRMTAEEFKFQAFNSGSNSSLANAETETNTETRFWINSEGNVSVGSDTLDPDSPEKFRVDAGVTSSYNLINGVGSRNGYLQLNIQNLNNGNSASSDIVATANNGSESTVYIDMGINSQGYSTGASNILNGSNTAYLFATGNNFYIGNGAQNKDLIFFTNTGATGPDGTERMRILSGGAICIGQATANGANKLTVNGSISASAFNVSSDRRLKTNIRNTHYGLKQIMNLQPVSWNWIDKSKGATPQLGLIAQDVRKTMPEIVSGNEQTGTLSINYTELIPVLINAIKEQQQQIELLTKEVNLLKRKN